MNDTTKRNRAARFDALTPAQRILAFRRLGLKEPERSDQAPPETAHERLAAYLVPRPGSDLPPVGELRKFLAERLPDFMIPSAFVAVDRLPLTPNGKVDRQALASREIRPLRPVGDETAVAQTPAASATVAGHLLEIWRKVLGNPAIGPDDDFFESGGDSILAIQIIARAAQSGLNMRLTEFFQTPTVSQMAAKLTVETGRPQEPAPVALSTTAGPIPLSPIQHWFFEQGFGEHRRWNQARALLILSGTDSRQLARALGAVLKTHRTLNHAFLRKPAGWLQVAKRAADNPEVEAVDCAGLDAEERATAVDNALAALNRAIHPDAGRLITVAHLKNHSAEADLLLVAAHHLAVDGISWTILLEDLETACRQVRLGEPIRLPAPFGDFGGWVEQLHAHAQTSAVTAHATYWTDQSWNEAGRLPRDRNDDRPNNEASAECVRLGFTDSETRHLVASARSMHGAEINEILIAALVRAMAGWAGSAAVLIGIEGHGRETFDGCPDVTRTVGWFTSFFPVLFKVESSNDPAALAAGVKSALRAVPGKGLSFGLLKYLTNDPAIARRMAMIPQTEIVFNYLGNGRSAPPRPDPLPSVEVLSRHARSPEAPRAAVFEVNSWISGGCLEIALGYSRHLHPRTTAEAVLDRMRGALSDLGQSDPSRMGTGPDAGDFPDSGLGQADLDRLFGRVP